MGSLKWTEEVVREQVYAVMKHYGIDHFPSYKMMIDYMGNVSLKQYVNRTGGITKWSKEFGLMPPESYKWNWKHIETELLACMNSLGIDYMPTQKEIRFLGRDDLLGAMLRIGGMQVVSQKLGIPYIGHKKQCKCVDMEIAKAKARVKVKVDILTEADKKRKEEERAAEERYAAQCKASLVNADYKGERIFLPREVIERKFKNIRPEPKPQTFYIGVM